MTTQTQTSAVLTALSAAANVIVAVAPQAPAVIALIQLAVTLVNENRDPTSAEWDAAISTLDDAHSKAQAALALVVAVKTAVDVKSPEVAPSA